MMKVKTFNIDICIEEFGRSAAIEKLQQVAKEIKGGITGCSEHPCKEEPYLPHTWYSCQESEREVYSEKWIEEYDKEEREKIDFIEK